MIALHFEYCTNKTNDICIQQLVFSLKCPYTQFVLHKKSNTFSLKSELSWFLVFFIISGVLVNACPFFPNFMPNQMKVF